MNHHAHLLEQRVQQCFNRSAPTHRAHANAQMIIGHRLIDLLCQHAPGDAQALVVELGCGQSPLANRLAQNSQFDRYLGLDLAGDLLTNARHSSTWVKHNERYTLDWIQADMSCLPLARNSVDVILCSMTMHWCVQVNEALQAIKRVLKPGGYAAIAIPIAPTMAALKNRIADLGGGQILNPFWLAQEWQELFPLSVSAFVSFEHTLRCANTSDAITHIKGVGANCLWHQNKPGATPVKIPTEAKTLSKWRHLRQQSDWHKPIDLCYHTGLWVLQA